MPFYEYKAISEKGKKYHAVVDAESLQEAKLKLLRGQVAVLTIELVSNQKIKTPLSRIEILNLTRELGRLLQAGLPLYESLSALEEKYRQQKPHRLLLNLCEKVRSGLSFSQSLSKHPEVFDLLYISMVANAERTGRLAEALNELCELLSKQQQIRKQIVAALLYPGLLMGFCLIVLSSLLFYVIPSLKELFDGRSLHPFTRIVFAFSDFACHSKGLLFAILIAIMVLIGVAITSKRSKEKLFSFVLRLPFFKSLFVKVAFVRFSRAAATLLEGGVPLIQAFEQGRVLMRHPTLEEIIGLAQERIGQGESIHSTLENHPLIPPLIPRMISIAEQGGKLPFMLKQIAQIYEEEIEKTLTHFAAIAQPALLLILGVIIGFVLLSVLLPMTDVSSFATI